MVGRFFAHSKPDAPEDYWEPPEDHLQRAWGARIQTKPQRRPPPSLRSRPAPPDVEAIRFDDERHRGAGSALVAVSGIEQADA